MRRRAFLHTASLPVATLLLLGATGPLLAREIAIPRSRPVRRGRLPLEDAGVPERSRAELRERPVGAALPQRREHSLRSPRVERHSPLETAAPAASLVAPDIAERPLPRRAPAGPSRWDEAAVRIERLVAEAKAGGVVAVSVAGPSGERYRHEATRPMATASLYKLLVLAAVHDAVVRRRSLAWTQRVLVRPDDLREGSAFRAGESYTLHALVDGMVAASDNGAAGALLRVTGSAERANEMARELGMRDTAMVDGSGAVDRLAGYNYTTAADMEAYFSRLLEGGFIDAETSAAMLARIERNRIRDRLPALLPAGARVVDKPGDLPGIKNDVGVLFTPAGPIVVAALTFAFADGTAATRLMNELGKALWEYGSVRPA